MFLLCDPLPELMARLKAHREQLAAAVWGPEGLRESADEMGIPGGQGGLNRREQTDREIPWSRMTGYPAVGIATKTPGGDIHGAIHDFGAGR